MGDNLLLMASSDNYLGNSICLVNCPQRQWAQITHWGSRLVAESLVLERLSLQCLTKDITPSTWSVDWKFSPFLPPFFHWRFRSWPPTGRGEYSPLRDPQPDGLRDQIKPYSLLTLVVDLGTPHCIACNPCRDNAS